MAAGSGISYSTGLHLVMKTIEPMLRTHPGADGRHVTDYADTLDLLAACEQTCTACADACLGETEHLTALRHCISTNLDCADVCTATARVLARQTEPPNALIETQLHACVLACQLCADECRKHARMHQHCRICAETCRQCQERCNFLLGEISSSGVEEDFGDR
jgi:hypothetical protein